jgi:hypothetical protein
MPSQREIAAHHEADHAVVALARRIPVRSASIRPRKDSFGRVITPRLPPDKMVDIQLYVILAGPFAHRRFAPRSNWLTGDFNTMARMIFGKRSWVTAANKEKYSAKIVEHAEGIVDFFGPTSR